MTEASYRVHFYNPVQTPPFELGPTDKELRVWELVGTIKPPMPLEELDGRLGNILPQGSEDPLYGYRIDARSEDGSDTTSHFVVQCTRLGHKNADPAEHPLTLQTLKLLATTIGATLHPASVSYEWQ